MGRWRVTVEASTEETGHGRKPVPGGAWTHRLHRPRAAALQQTQRPGGGSRLTTCLVTVGWVLTGLPLRVKKVSRVPTASWDHDPA